MYNNGILKGGRIFIENDANEIIVSTVLLFKRIAKKRVTGTRKDNIVICFYIEL